jgi:hypothetical protein
MLWNIMPASIMFLITIGFVSLFFIPIVAFQRPNKIVNFYWVGVWLFLAMITAIAGAQNTLMLLKYDANLFSEALLFSIVASFVFFVVFAWFRLSSVALWYGVKKVFRKTVKDA